MNTTETSAADASAATSSAEASPLEIYSITKTAMTGGEYRLVRLTAPAGTAVVSEAEIKACRRKRHYLSIQGVHLLKTRHWAEFFNKDGRLDMEERDDLVLAVCYRDYTANATYFVEIHGYDINLPCLGDSKPVVMSPYTDQPKDASR